jgi:hypothetical protein
MVTSCANKKINDDVVYNIKPPKWVVGVQTGGDFYSVGVTNKSSILKTSMVYAKNNAIENLRMNIFVKLEELFSNEAAKISNEKKVNTIINVLNDKIRTGITIDYLDSISRIDDVWRSTDNDTLYLMVFVDKDNVINKIISLLDEIKLKYTNDSEIENLIKDIKNDMIYNNFKINSKQSVIQRVN